MDYPNRQGPVLDRIGAARHGALCTLEPALDAAYDRNETLAITLPTGLRKECHCRSLGLLVGFTCRSNSQLDMESLCDAMVEDDAKTT